MKFVSWAVIFLMSFSVQADVLQKALEKYAKASSIQFDIKKTDEKMALQTISESNGYLKFQKNKIYILQNSDKKTELFYADKILTLVEHPDQDFGDSQKRKVTILKKSTPPLIKSLLNLFSNPKNFNKEFSVLSCKTDGNFEIIALKPAQKNIKSFNLKIRKADLGLTELSFVDDVDTKTTIQFSNLTVNTKMNKSEFQYQSQKTDEVLYQ